MTQTSPATLSREATGAAYRKHHVANDDHAFDSEAWASLADQFADDATYFDSFYGHYRGKEAIRAFLRRSMAGLEDWRFPVQWVEIGEGRVVVHLMNRVPGQRPDGTFYEFPSVSILHYNTAGQVVSQVDIYDRVAAVKTVVEAKAGALSASVAGGLSALARVISATLRRTIAGVGSSEPT